LAYQNTSTTGDTKRRRSIKSGADEQLEEDGGEDDEDDEDILGRNVVRSRPSCQELNLHRIKTRLMRRRKSFDAMGARQRVLDVRQVCARVKLLLHE